MDFTKSFERLNEAFKDIMPLKHGYGKEQFSNYRYADCDLNDACPFKNFWMMYILEASSMNRATDSRLTVFRLPDMTRRRMNFMNFLFQVLRISVLRTSTKPMNIISMLMAKTKIKG